MVIQNIYCTYEGNQVFSEIKNLLLLTIWTNALIRSNYRFQPMLAQLCLTILQSNIITMYNRVIGGQLKKTIFFAAFLIISYDK